MERGQCRGRESCDESLVSSRRAEEKQGQLHGEQGRPTLDVASRELGDWLRRGPAGDRRRDSNTVVGFRRQKLQTQGPGQDLWPKPALWRASCSARSPVCRARLPHALPWEQLPLPQQRSVPSTGLTRTRRLHDPERSPELSGQGNLGCWKVSMVQGLAWALGVFLWERAQPEDSGREGLQASLGWEPRTVLGQHRRE